ncbi:STAS domain-containing protein [Acrocarpospora catenulata]|uniref:STAS domain-containing protein n=1 Tax=Acrocarpospora catenulata TaxID=2836182 RepID=UPI001BD940D0|nr:STAS domain-containing protein [Acrocarpospora catenulata]
MSRTHHYRRHYMDAARASRSGSPPSACTGRAEDAMTSYDRPATQGTSLSVKGCANIQVLHTDAILNVTHVATPDSSLVRLSGELDISNSFAVQNALTLVRRRDLPLIVDVGRVTFVDVAGARLLIILDRENVSLRNIPPRMRFLLDMLLRPRAQDADPRPPLPKMI